MCVIFFALNKDNCRPLILLANRDEYYARPTKAVAYWDDFPHIYGGRDLQGGGTWLGVTNSGRFSAVTNYRDPLEPMGSRSRGELVAEFLKSDLSARQYLENVCSRADDYSGFNLLVGEHTLEREEVHYYSNRGGDPCQLSTGIYGLSNHLLDTPWPKVEKGKSALSELLERGNSDVESLFELLADDLVADDDKLPETGIPYAKEKALSAIHIKTPGYGTRSSTVLTFDEKLKWNLTERVFV